MKKKVTIKWINGEQSTLQINSRDVELININKLNHSHIFKNRKTYNRKVKHKKDID